MTSSALAAPDGPGAQQPRILHKPDYASSAGEEAVELAAMAGLDLDPWQQLVLTHALGERPDGRWAAFEVGLVVPRQNGKGGLLEARSLAGLFLLGERLIVHSAHQFDTSLEAFRRLLALIEDTPELSRRVKRVSRAHGEEGIELQNRQRIRFRTRTKGGGRGFTGDCLLLDEAMILPEAAHGALLPTLSARPNPQVWYTGSAVDREVHEHGLVFARARKRGIAGDDGLVYAEWSADGDLDRLDGVLDDRAAWAQANPGLGIRISEEHVALERAAMDPRTFAVERLGIGDWPDPDEEDQGGISEQAWRSCLDVASGIAGPVYLALDVKPDRSYAAIGAAGTREDRLRHIEVVDHRPGTGWLAARARELVDRHSADGMLVALGSPAASLIPELERAGVKVRPVKPVEHAQACGVLFDHVNQGAVRHLGTPELTAAVRGAARRQMGEAWAWSRKSSAMDISPLVAVTLALWGAEREGQSVYEDRGLLVVSLDD